MDAVSLWQAGKPYILLSEEKHSLPRENYDLAHELAHLLCQFPKGVLLPAHLTASVRELLVFCAPLRAISHKTRTFYNQTRLHSAIAYFNPNGTSKAVVRPELSTAVLTQRSRKHADE